MKILHVSVSTDGGAGRAALRLHDGLRCRGSDSHFTAMHPYIGENVVLRPLSRQQRFAQYTKLVASKLITLLQRTPTNQVIHSPGLFPSGLGRWINASDFDIVNLHWVGWNMLSVKEIGRIDKPIVWTMHDMWPFMGAEHYDDLEHPGRWKMPYTAANRPPTYRGMDIDRYTWARKARYWNDKRFYLVAPSRWLAQCAKDSALMGEMPCNVIPNPLDTAAFAPVDKDTARQLLGLPANKKLLLFGAIDGPTDQRKGYDLLLSALKDLECEHGAGQDAELLVFGGTRVGTIRAGDNEPGLASHFTSHFLGTLHDQLMLRLVYSAADVLIAPSRQDNLPNMVVEAMACGTPVAAFDIGGMPDLIAEGRTGTLAPPFDCAALAGGIHRLLTAPPERTKVREAIVAKVGHEATIPAYLSLYEHILGLER